MALCPAAMATLAAFCLLLGPQFAACQSEQALSQPQMQGFIHIANGRFVDDRCLEFHFHGWNGWRLLDYALNDPSYITEKFKAAQQADLNVMRFFLADDDNGPQLQTTPGVFDERSARALDWLLSEAATYGIKVTLVLMNTWKKNNGIPQFEEWCGTTSSSTMPRPDMDPRGGSLSASERLQTPYDWFMSAKCRQQVKDYFSAIVNRRNTITGFLYKDDPTIFSWNLLNEPRCKYCGPEAVDTWYGEMATHLKSQDPNHLVTTGAEGFFAEGDAMEGFNPNNSTHWASRSGQDFRGNHAHAAIDYAVMHLWPDNWRKPAPAFDTAWGRKWIEAHVKVAAQLGKPVVLEEFGKEATDGNIASVRDPWFVMVQGTVDEALQSDGALRGALFWQWDGESGPRPNPGNSIHQEDSTFQKHIVPFAKKMAGKGTGTAPGCIPRSSATSGGARDGLEDVLNFSGAGRKLLQAARD